MGRFANALFPGRTALSERIRSRAWVAAPATAASRVGASFLALLVYYVHSMMNQTGATKATHHRPEYLLLPQRQIDEYAIRFNARDFEAVPALADNPVAA